MKNYLNKTELRKKFKICADTLDKILNYLNLPFEIRMTKNYKQVPYYNQENINKIEKFIKEEYNSNFFFSLSWSKKGWSIPMIAKELNCDRCKIERMIKILNLHYEKGKGKQNYYTDNEKDLIVNGLNSNIRKEFQNLYYVHTLAKYFNVDDSTINHWIDFLNLNYQINNKGKYLDEYEFDKLKNYVNNHDIHKDIWKSKKQKYFYNGYTLLSSLKENYNISNIPYNYCDYLGIKVYDFPNHLSGNISHYIKNKDVEKLINYLNSMNSKERQLHMMKITNNKKFGCDYYSQSSNAKRKSKWLFDNINFDSKWEIYYYFYLKNNNINFQMQIPMDYYEDNGKHRVYKCDFYLIDSDEYIEIKNPKCLNEKGELIEFYKSDSKSKINAKYKCMIEHNVKIISKEKIEFYMEYFKKNCKIPIIDARKKSNE